MQALYFAYGSDMLSCRTCERVPPAAVRGPAHLPRHRLTPAEPAGAGEELERHAERFTPRLALAWRELGRRPGPKLRPERASDS